MFSIAESNQFVASSLRRKMLLTAKKFLEWKLLIINYKEKLDVEWSARENCSLLLKCQVWDIKPVSLKYRSRDRDVTWKLQVLNK